VRGDAAVRVEAPGGAIADRYRLLRPLGAGSSATVWAAADETLGRQVALKLLTPSGDAADGGRERARLRREARALATLAHPHIVTVFDFFEAPTVDGTVQPVLVTELLEGESLAARQRRGPLPWAEALSVCGQVADALAAAHRAGIVHRDVTPNNVFLTAAGAKLLDFGIAQGPADRGPSRSMATGTPVCMAPEQLTGRGALPASDVYAFGCVLYWCLVGHPPYREVELTGLSRAHLHADPPALAIAGPSPGIDALYAACLAKDPARRPTIDDVLAVLAPNANANADGAAEPAEADDPPRFLPAVTAVAEEPAGETPRAAARHAGSREGLGRRRLLPVGLLLGALAVIAVMMLGMAHTITGGTTAAPGASKASAGAASASAMSGGADAGASPTPTTASVLLPGVSASPSAAASSAYSQAPNSPALALPALPDPATDPVGYLQGVSNQIQDLIAQGAGSVQPTTGQDLLNSIAALENTVSSAERNNGKKQLRTTASAISAVEQQISNDAAAGRLSPAAANLLTGELQRLAAQLPAGNNGNGG
jgi:eukaryotic-like serine/threonine-protein kinase